MPYLPQSVLLCGGAALAMVERWWGRRGVYAEDFAGLVRPASGGILTTDLAFATRARGWDTEVFRGTPEVVRQNLRDGVPVVALIEAGEDRYHYVVVLGWNDGSVVFHDPATAPFAMADEDAFLVRWAEADWWAMVIRPTPAAAVAVSADNGASGPDSSMPCSPWLDRALDAVAAGRLEDASSLLAEAGRACPQEPLVLRETAGVRFKQGRHAEAIRLVSEYLGLVPDDEHGWNLLATSRYLTGDRDGALEAWNEIGRPNVDLLRIEGVRQVRFREIAGAISVPPGTLLTPSRLALARRRVSDVPALRHAAVEYQPFPGGIVEVRAAVVERPTVDRAARLAAAGAIRAVAQHEVSVEVASPTGGGELWTVSWRWQAARPRARIRLDMPADPGLPGVIAIEGARETFRFAIDPSNATILEETRRSAVLGFGAWVTAGLKPSVAIRLERWSGDRRFLVLRAGAEVRARNDRFELRATVERAVALSAHMAYARSSASAAWASSLGLGRPAWSARLGLDWAGRHAPLGTWPVVGSYLDWAIPLRAHTPTDDGFLVGGSVGRGIIHAGFSGDHPLYRKGPVIIAAGVFIDAAEVLAAADGAPDDRFRLDVGAGLRIGMADGQLGVLRIDVARGVAANRRFAITLGVHQSWPLWQPGFQ